MIETVQYRLADVDVAIEAPADILAIVAQVYQRFHITKGHAEAQASVHAQVDDEGQVSIHIGDRLNARISAAAGSGAVAAEISNAIITAVAQKSRFLIIHGAALERNGEALCIAARGHMGKTLLAAHLVSRGWRLLSDDYAFVEPLSGNIVPFPKLLFVRSSSLPHIPRSFRKSVESSLWHGLGERHGIVFSGVDPSRSYGQDVWSPGARITRLLVLEGLREKPSIENTPPWGVIPDLNSLVWQGSDLLEALTRLATALRSVRVGRLTSGTPLHTANAVEGWAREQSGVALSA